MGVTEFSDVFQSCRGFSSGGFGTFLKTFYPCKGGWCLRVGSVTRVADLPGQPFFLGQDLEDKVSLAFYLPCANGPGARWTCGLVVLRAADLGRSFGESSSFNTGSHVLWDPLAWERSRVSYRRRVNTEAVPLRVAPSFTPWGNCPAFVGVPVVRSLCKPVRC